MPESSTQSGSDGRTTAYLLLTLVALSWAANTIVARATVDEVPPVAMTFWRLFLSAVIFAPFALSEVWRRRDVIRRRFWLLNGLALLSMTAFNALVYTGLQYTEAINGNLLQGTLPVCILLSGLFFAGRRITARQTLGVILCMTGLAIIVIRGDVASLLDLRINAGDPLIFAGVFASASYAVFLFKRPEELGLIPFLFLMMAFGSIQIAPVYLAEHIWIRPVPVTETSLATLAFVALVPSVLAQWWFAEGVRRVGAATAGYMIYLTPVFGVAMAIGVLGEAFRTFHAAGIILIAAGIALATIARNRH